MGEPAAGEIEVRFYSMPFSCVELAAGENIERRAGRYGNVGNDKTGMVGRESIMNGLGENTKVVV